MNSHRKSDGKKLQVLAFNRVGRALLSFLLAFSFMGCSALSKRSTEASEVDPQEISYKDDQKSIQELRKNIPLETREQNDELAVMLKMIGEHITTEPNKVRGKFDKLVRKKRERFRKTLKKDRLKFTKTERKTRDQFLKKLKKERKSYLSTKREREERREFFDDQRQSRKEYFANERDNRKEFESMMRQKSNDFNGETREQIKQFYQEWGLYSRRYRERKKQEKQEKRDRQRGSRQGRFMHQNNSYGAPKNIQTLRPGKGHSSALDEFDEMRNIPSQDLSTDGK